MLDEDIRRAIYTLHQKGHGLRAIARTLRISRNSVKKILLSGTSVVPKPERPERLGSHAERIRELHRSCAGNLVRVAECLEAEGVTVAYPTLTAFCRRHGIGVKEKQPAGRYHFEPGEEMQHDTSPHDVKVGGKLRRVQCASLVLCFSRRIFAQGYPTWDRFHCKIFLTKAVQYFGGVANRCMLDNHSVIIVRGTGPDAVPAPEMVALAERLGDFAFVAHEVGDANRSARVEGPFYFIERNFYPGRTFVDFDDLNAQFIAWCDKVNAKHSPKLRTSRNALFAVEQPRLKPLPLFIPDVYALHHRMVDLEGYVSVHGNRYSTPVDLIGRRVEVRESERQVRIFDGPREVCAHRRDEPGVGARNLLPEHRLERRPRNSQRHGPPLREEAVLRAAGAPFPEMVKALRKRYPGRAVRAMRRLHRMYIDYPDQPLRAALTEALQFGLVDLERIERMVLRRIAGDFFRLSPPGEGGGGDDRGHP